MTHTLQIFGAVENNALPNSNTPRKRGAARSLSLLAAVICTALVGIPAFAQQGPQGGAMPAMDVGAITMEQQTVPRSYTIPGRAVAHEQADIRPRVDGVIQKIIYQPGVTLAVGDPLFELDDATYVASVAANEAAVASAQANVPVAQAAYERAERLEGSSATVAQVETARATLASAQATLSAAQAALDYSKIQLSWTTIRSPIKGVAATPNFSVGDLVTSGQADALTTITRLDPIDVDMLETSARILAIRNLSEAGTLKMNERIAATLVLETGQTYQTTGSMVAPAVTVSTTTGSVSIRFRFDNPEGIILPGMFLRGHVDLGTMTAFLVPQRAATRETDGQLSVFTVGADNTAEQLRFSDAGTWDNNWIVTEGIEPGTHIILDGLKSIKAGSKVNPIAASVDENGLVQDLATDPAAGK